MKNATKTKLCKAAGFTLAAALMFSAAPAASLFAADAYGNSEEVTEESNVLTSNLIQDGSFENVVYDQSNAKVGAWDVDITSSVAGTGGSVSIVEDAYSGSNALRLTSPGNKSGYPEISQTINVLPNTTYYVSLRVRIDYVNAIFFGLASVERESETIYGQLHRWGDTSIDEDHNTADDRVTIDGDEFSGYALYSAHFTTGNETQCRFFIREEKSDLIIDDVYVTYEGNAIPAGEENLLENGGFEESTGSNPLKGWLELENNAAAGSEVGIDALDTSTYMRTTQDKQMEGLNTLYLAAKEGFSTDDNITIGQEVSVKANTNYTFTINLSKYGDAKRAATETATAQGIQRVTVGIYAADKETVLVSERVDGANISLACYRSFGVMTNTGENTTVYPFIKFESAAGGQWGNCLYVDDCAFFEHALDLPEGKTNLLSNGDLTAQDDDWYMTVTGEGGYQSSSPYVGGSVWMNEWYPYNGMLQSTNLKADKVYKVTANVVSYLGNWSDSSLWGPASIIVIKGNDNAVQKQIKSIVTSEEFSWSDLDALDVVAKQSVTISPVSNWFYHPVNLIFSVPEDGEYSILVGFEYGAYDAVNDCWRDAWLGGMNVGSVTMYETSMEELSPEKETTPADVIGTLDTVNVSFGDDSVIVANGTPVSHFKTNVYGYGDYIVKVVDADGTEVTSGNMQAGYKVVVYTEGDEENALEFAVAVTDHEFESGNGGNNGDNNGDNNNGDNNGENNGENNGDNNGEKPDPEKENGWVLPVVIAVVAVVAVAAVVAVVVVVKKKKSGK